jgi:hypothetical protein
MVRTAQMKLSTLAEVVGVSAIILSLVFVGVEIRNNTAATKAQALLELNVAANDLSLAVVDNGEFSEILVTGDANVEELSEAGKARYRRWVYAMLNVHENAFIFNSAGLLDEASYAAWASSTCVLLAKPGVDAMWRDETLVFHENFNEFIESRCNLTR